MTMFISILFDVFLGLLSFQKRPSRDAGPVRQVGYWGAALFKWLFTVIAVGAAILVVYAQIKGNFNEKVPVGEIVAVEAGAASKGLSWVPVETAALRVRIKPPHSFSRGDTAYIIRTRMSGLKFCTDRGCSTMQIVHAPDEFRDAVVAWPFK